MHAIVRRPEVAHIKHPNAVVLRPPVNVSPLIRGARWSALLMGICWGYYRYRELCRIHVDVREYEHKQEMAELQMQEKIRKWMLIESTHEVLDALGLDQSDELLASFGADVNAKPGMKPPADAEHHH